MLQLHKNSKQSVVQSKDSENGLIKFGFMGPPSWLSCVDYILLLG